MPKPFSVDHRGREVGPFVVVEAGSRKRYWRLRCTRGHITERRIDNMLRARPETLRCVNCQRSTPPSVLIAYQQFIDTLGPESLGALWTLLEAVRAVLQR